MNSVAGNQARTFAALLQGIRSQIRTDRNLPLRIQQSITKEKRFGSRDRRLYRELLYTAVRYWPWYEKLEKRSAEEALLAVVWLAAPLPAVLPLKAMLGEKLPPLPPTIAERASVLAVNSALLPAWVAQECPAAAQSPELETLHRRAPLWLRVLNDSKDRVLAEFTQLGWTWRESSLLPSALELLGDVDATKTEAFSRGLIEVQDLGSQLLLEAVGIAPGTRWLDACAGAGGKTLQLAQLTGPSGRVTAHDIRVSALDELSTRAQRSRVSNIDISLAPTGEFDGVLVDAPCSGSGTWRRAPHLKWSTSPATIEASVRLQEKLLADFARFVRPKGLLVYATCSLCQSENAAVARAFLASNTHFQEIPLNRMFTGKPAGVGTAFWPSGHDGDGFFVAVMRRS